jgi:phage terminase small subunit
MPRAAVKKAKPASRSKSKAEKDKKPPSNAALTFPDGTMIDLSAYDWEGERLTEAQKLFIVWFATPGTEYYHKAMKAARKAGYTPKTANAVACKMRCDPKIKKFIDKIEDTIVKVNTIDVAQRWIQEKIVRGDFKVRDFYETIQYVNEKTGETVRKLVVKEIEELTDEQLLCIDGVDAKGMQGTTIYSLPDREKIRDSLIALIQKSQGETNDEYDIETIAEIIKVNLQVKTRVINQNKEIMSRARGFIEAPERIIEEE